MMSLLARLSSLARNLFRTGRAERDLDQELRGYLELLTEEKIAAGLTPQAARRSALLELGGMEQVKEEVRAVRTGEWLLGLGRDLRYAGRGLRQNPGFTLIAVLTLALGIGANTAIFTVLNAILLRALPVENPRQLVVLSDPNYRGMVHGQYGGDRSVFAYYEFEELRDRNRVFAGSFAVDGDPRIRPVSVAGPAGAGETEPARISLVSGEYFSVLGVGAALGRTFTGQVDRVKNANPVAVISYGYWKSRFGLDPSVLGRRIRIRRTWFEIIGVARAGFFGETVGFSPDLWIPLTMQPAVLGREDFLARPADVRRKMMWLQVMARMKPGVTREQASAEVNGRFQQLLRAEADAQIPASQRPAYLQQRIALVNGSGGGSVFRGSFGKPLQILMALVGLVLLIACANVATLLLARATARQRDMAARVALGATRGRVMQQMLTESLLLALLGGGLGLLLARWADALLVRLVAAGSSPAPLDVRPDGRVLGFTIGLSLLTGILFGLAPAIRLAGLKLSSVLKGAAKGRVASGAPGKVLVVGQVALSLVLLIVAGLFARSLQKLTRLHPGYDRDRLLLARVATEPGDYPGDALKQLDQRLLERLRVLPGVVGVSVSSRGLFQSFEVDLTVWAGGATPPPGQTSYVFDYVGPGYFSTLGLPIVAGREIGPKDEGNAPRVGVINQAMARAFFGRANPIGRRLWANQDHPFEFEVVGVAADAKYESLREDPPGQAYLPYFHESGARRRWSRRFGTR